MISIQVIGGPSVKPTRPAALWTPDVPDWTKIEMFSIPLLAQPSIFNLHLNMELEPMEKLHRIVALMNEKFADFLGFKFLYTDGHSTVSGSSHSQVPRMGLRPALELSFLIDGPSGERIQE